MAIDPNADGAQRNRRRTPTLIDIAEAAQVSKSTVSRVLNGSPNVSPEARTRVREAVEKLDYRINLAARTLRTTRTAQAGLLIPAINNEVFGEIAEQLDSELREAGVGLSIASSGWNPDAEAQALDALESRRVDVVVLALVDERHRPSIERVKRIDAPVVLLDRDVRGLVADAVLTDNRTGVVQCMEHLAQLGHRSLGIVTGTDRNRPGREHLAAYAETVARLGLDARPDLVVSEDRYTRQSGSRAAATLVRAGATAIVGCAPVAPIAGMLDYLREAGVRIPDDVSFVEYTDSELAAMNTPPLSVILRPVDEIGRLAGRLAVSRMENDRRPPRVEIVGTRFLDRASTAPPRH